jgi:hypothetical protein
VCGEFWDGNFRDSETSQTKTNGVARKGEREARGPQVAQREARPRRGRAAKGAQAT